MLKKLSSKGFALISGLFVLMAGLVLTAGGLEAASQAKVVTDVRVGSQGKNTRFVLDLSTSLPFRAFVLGDPYRVVIDLPEVGWRLPQRPLPSNVGLMKSVRYGLFKEGTSRVVLDVSNPAKIAKAFLLPPSSGAGHRLVVDLAPTTKAEFAEILKENTPIFVASAGGAKETAGTAGFVPVQRTKPTARPVAPVPVSAPHVPNAFQKQQPQKKRIIAIDPGHGGVDPGALGKSGMYEKHITLAMGRALKEELEATGRYQVFMTRDRDIFIRLRDRVAKARDAGAELFISLHADTIRDRKIRGLSVYTLSERASDKEAAALAEKENKADLIAGVDLSGETQEVTNILIDLAQRETMNQSALFATNLVNGLKRETKLLRRTHRFAGFAVLKAPDVPSVLVELGFLSNKTDARNLASKKYRARLAKGMARAIDAHFVRTEEASRR